MSLHPIFKWLCSNDWDTSFNIESASHWLKDWCQEWSKTLQYYTHCWNCGAIITLLYTWIFLLYFFYELHLTPDPFHVFSPNLKVIKIINRSIIIYPVVIFYSKQSNKQTKKTLQEFTSKANRRAHHINHTEAHCKTGCHKNKVLSMILN